MVYLLNPLTTKYVYDEAPKVNQCVAHQKLKNELTTLTLKIALLTSLDIAKTNGNARVKIVLSCSDGTLPKST